MGLIDSAGKLTSHLAAEYEARIRTSQKDAAELKIKYTPPHGWWTFTRKIGSTTEELLVRDFSQVDGGKRVACSGSYQWCVTSDYAGKQPTLKELLKAIPSLQPLYREGALFDRLLDEPAFAFSTSTGKTRNSMWDIITVVTAQDDIGKVLKAQGFAPSRTINLPNFAHGAAKQQQWERLSDWSHASIITFTTNQERIGVNCQSPQKPPDK